MSAVTRRSFAAVAMTAASYSRIYGANERIRMGVLGSGNRAQYLMRLSNGVENKPEVVAIADVYEPAREEAKAKYAPEADMVGDHRAVLDRKDIDGVIIGSPDHWHVPMIIDAVNAGKDAYCEKPVSHSLEEHDSLIKGVRATKQVVQVGYQQRSYPHIQMARDLVQAGKLGNIPLIHTYWYQRVRVPVVAQCDPTKLDWARFCNGKQVEYSAMRYDWWRWFWPFGGGHLTDLFSHWVDTAHFVMGIDTPSKVQAMGGNLHAREFEVPDTITASVMYGNKLSVNYSGTLNGNVDDGGLLFRGYAGAMRLTRGGFRIFPEVDGARNEPLMEMKSLRDGTIAHLENFYDCMKSRKEPNCPVEAAVASARVAHLGNLSYKRGSAVSWPLNT